ncbi:hypothetical protein GCM10025783_23310 [Amnibacterium soli]|uniref:Uncharacterized protein n=1 Tax=Amnibacterium soli TaxID=1282736 RepID=A0ABP8Z991_9MICO
MSAEEAAGRSYSSWSCSALTVLLFLNAGLLERAGFAMSPVLFWADAVLRRRDECRKIRPAAAGGALCGSYGSRPAAPLPARSRTAAVPVSATPCGPPDVGARAYP